MLPGPRLDGARLWISACEGRHQDYMWLWGRTGFGKLEQFQFIPSSKYHGECVFVRGTSVQMTSALFFWNTIFFQRRVPLLSGKSLPDAEYIPIWKYQFGCFKFSMLCAFRLLPLSLWLWKGICGSSETHSENLQRPQQTLSKDGVLAGAVWKRKGTSPLIHSFMIHLVFGIWKSAAVCLWEDSEMAEKLAVGEMRKIPIWENL